MDEHLDEIRLVAQDIVGCASHDEARLLVGNALEGLAQHHEVLTAAEETGSAIPTHKGIVEEAWNMLVAFLEIAYVESAVFSHFFHQLTVVVSNAQKLGKPLTKLTATTAKLPSQSHYHFLFHDIICILVTIYRVKDML